MSALPAAVRKQVDAANKLVSELKTPKQPSNEPPTMSVVPAPPAPTEPPAAPPTPPVAPAPEEGWEHKYKVLQGKYNAEVPRLQRQSQEQEHELRELRTQLNNTQTLLASLNPGRPAVKAPASASPPVRLVKDEEIREFGPDLVDVMRRVSKEELALKDQEITDLRQRLAKAEETTASTAKTVAKTAEEKVIDMLDAQVPSWREQNADEEFLVWLDEVDPFTGSRRGQLLSQAYELHDGPRVVAFFKAYRNEHAAVQPPPAAPPAPPATPPAAPGSQATLDGLVAPGTPKSGAQGGAPADLAGKRVWSRPMVQELYARINEFTKKGKAAPKELKALEADLIVAQKEGRIQAT